MKRKEAYAWAMRAQWLEERRIKEDKRRAKEISDLLREVAQLKDDLRAVQAKTAKDYWAKNESERKANMDKASFGSFVVDGWPVAWCDEVIGTDLPPSQWDEGCTRRELNVRDKMIADLAREVARLREVLMSVQDAVIGLRNEKIVAAVEKQAAEHVKKTAKPKPAPRKTGRKLAVIKAPEVCPHRDFVIDRRRYVCLYDGVGGQRCRFNNEFPSTCPLPDAE